MLQLQMRKVKTPSSLRAAVPCCWLNPNFYAHAHSVFFCNKWCFCHRVYHGYNGRFSLFFFDTTPLGDFVLPGLLLYELSGRRWGSLSNLSAKPGEEQWGERLWEWVSYCWVMQRLEKEQHQQQPQPQLQPQQQQQAQVKPEAEAQLYSATCVSRGSKNPEVTLGSFCVVCVLPCQGVVPSNNCVFRGDSLSSLGSSIRFRTKASTVKKELPSNLTLILPFSKASVSPQIDKVCRYYIYCIVSICIIPIRIN